VNLQTDDLNCGACNNACAIGKSCVLGQCKLLCAGGTTECSGACYNLLMNPDHCGSCTNACAAGQVCQNGSCALECVGGLTECNGACTNTLWDPANCGGCATSCPVVPGATAVCAAGSCSFACSSGRGNCNWDPTDGCETDLGGSVQHCGQCGHACPVPPHAAASCNAGACGMGACEGGWASCDGDAANGCEADLKNDEGNCGGCGIECSPGASCVDGTCKSGPLFAMQATGINARISVANTGFGVGSGAFTFEFWVRIHSLFQATFNPPDVDSGIIFTMNENYAAYAIRPMLAVGRKMLGQVYNNGSGGMGLLANPIPAGDTGWHHFAMLHNGSGTCTVFLDGVLQAQNTSCSPIVNATSPMAIGKPAGYGGYQTSPVSLGGIRYSKVVRYPDGTTFTPASSWPVDSNTIAQYLTQQGLGATLVDEAGGDNTGTLYGGWIPETP